MLPSKGNFIKKTKNKKTSLAEGEFENHLKDVGTEAHEGEGVKVMQLMPGQSSDARFTFSTAVLCTSLGWFSPQALSEASWLF